MSSRYETWLTDDSGRRILSLQDLSYLTFTRAVSGMGTCQFGLPLEILTDKLHTWFQPDWRLDVWRSPAQGYALRREDVFFIRRASPYIRQDGVQMITLYGRNGIDLLKRRHVIQRAGTSWASKTDFADDMMKEIVREQMLYGSVVDEDGVQDNTRAWPQGEFTVQADVSLGPSMPRDFEGAEVFDVLKGIKEATFQKYRDDPDNEKRIFFDVVPVDLDTTKISSGAPQGWMFTTKAGLYGKDRTNEREFSLENENIDNPTYSISHLEEVNSVYMQGGGRGESQITENVTDAARIGSSRWNRVEAVKSSSNQTETTSLQDSGASELEANKPKEDFPVTFLNVPSSLYGIDWDLGDRVRVNYAQKQFEVEINIVYVSFKESGEETITGRNEIQNA